MDIHSSKIELTKLILDIENPELIEKIRSIITGLSDDFWNELSDPEKKEIELGLKQLNEGRSIPLEDFMNEVS